MIRAAAIAMSCLAGPVLAQCEGWVPIPGHPTPYTGGEVVSAVAFDPDGPGPQPEQLVVGGTGLQFQGLPPAAIYRWDGARWHTMGDGFDTGVFALRVWRGELYAGGDFARSGPEPITALARWTGERWQALPGGTFTRAPGVPTVRALTEHDGKLVAVGGFKRVGDLAAENIVAWDGASFSNFGAGLNNYVRAAVVHNGQLVVGGDFNAGDGRTALHVAQWTGTAWRFVGAATNDQGVNGNVRALASFDGRLVVAGEFTIAGSLAARRIAAWDGQHWAPLGDGLNQTVRGLLPVPGGLLALGAFTDQDGSPAAGIALWTGGRWSAQLGQMSRIAGNDLGASGVVAAPWRDGYVVGGTFDRIGAVGACSIAFRGPDGWSSFAQGLAGGAILCTAEYRGQFYVGGAFTNDGRNILNGLARWNGRRWAPVAGWAAPSRVNSLVVGGDRLWIAGRLAPSADPAVPTVAAAYFDGDRIVYGVGGPPAIGEVFWGGERAVYWHGRLVLPSGQPPACWDGQAWSDLAADLPTLAVRSDQLAVFRDDLFFNVSQQAPSEILRTNGSSVQSLPPNGIYFAADLLQHEDRLYACGAMQYPTVSVWDGETWTNNAVAYIVRRFASTSRGLFASAEGYRGDQSLIRLTPTGGHDATLPVPRIETLYFPQTPLGDFFGALLATAPAIRGPNYSDGNALFVSGPPVIIGQPLAVPCSGPRLDVVAIGMNLRYQWRRDGAPIDGATSDSLDLARLGPSGRYDCLIANDCGQILSSPVLFTPCPADFNCDGFADFFDYDAFLADFEAGLPAADLNADRFVDLFDYADFVAAFELGC